MFYRVIVNLPFNKEFWYKSDSDIKIGSVVTVPFGKNVVYGITSDKSDNADVDIAIIKDIESINDIISFSESDVSFIKKFSRYNVSKLGNTANIVLSNIEKIGKRFSSKIEKISKIDKIDINDISLSQEQESIKSQITPLLSSFNPILIDGVTGSGKTSVYLSIISDILRSDDTSQILIMVPEVSLTFELEKKITYHFGIQPVIWHYSVTNSKKSEYLYKINHGYSRVVVGTRSSIFLPYKNLSLIIIDEEHDSSYKQQDSPSYNGKDMAIFKAQILDIPVIMLSATPSVESLHNVNIGKYKSFQLHQRFHDVQMPIVNIVDISKDKSKYIISQSIIDIVSEKLQNGEQVMFFVNRRGYSSNIACNDCRSIIECKNCSAAMTYHASRSILICHHCNYRIKYDNTCHKCKSQNLKELSYGVEKIDEEVNERLTDLAKTIIVSTDMIKEDDIEGKMTEISENKYNVIIGTQMVAKGHNFPKLSTVIIVDSYVGNLSGDFRVYEKTFQLITQVSGRAGRIHNNGTVFIQTYNPHQNVKNLLECISNNDKIKFYHEEIRRRNGFIKTPPFVKYISITIASSIEASAYKISNSLKDEIIKELNDITDFILGPTPCSIKRINKRFRFEIRISTPRQNAMQCIDALSSIIYQFKIPSNAMIKIDVDPYCFY
jgi:primosomal protein N' (replication factor Y)